MTETDDLLKSAKEMLDYNPETGLFRWKVSRRGSVKAGDIAGSVRADGYVRLKIAQQGVWAHRLAWLWMYGVWPSHTIDHVNGNPTDNRIRNLRDVPQRTNSENMRSARLRKNGGSLIGAHWSTTWKRWKSSIGINGKTIHIGWFDTEQAAHEAYVSAKRKLHEGCTI